MDVRGGLAALAALAVAGVLAGPGAAFAASPAGEDLTGAQARIEAIGQIHPVTQGGAEKIAARRPEVAEARRAHPELSTVSERQDSGNWQVGFVGGGDELVQVIVDDQTGKVLETWTGYQVAWRMARGYDGAFGRKVNAPYIWLPLCAIFVIGLFDRRRPLRASNIDLVVLTAGLGVSHYFFNRGDIGLSVPLAYPVLLYLLARALWMAFKGAPPLRPSVPVKWLAIATLFLIGFRVGLDVADSNVIDVGYSGVVGADRIADGETLYGNFPSNNQHGDTYGPFSYYAYVPFEQILPWSGDWDDLPAAHAASVFFDLAAVAGLFLLGRRLRRGREGEELGIVLAFAWAACPYTAFALESNTNDALVAALLIGALCVLASPLKRGVAIGLATATKFAPLALAPLFGTYGAEPGRRAWLRTAGIFAASLLAAIAVVMAQTLIDPGAGTFIDRTLGFQGGRDSPFSIWGQIDLGPLHALSFAFAGTLALAVAVRPRRRTPETVAVLAAAVLIATQLTMDHWFYLYVPWFFGLYAVGMVGGVQSPADLRASPASR